jgi:hypothetical protein
MPIINEGETGDAQGAKNLIYPNINSCLTITIICAGSVAVGGHCVLFPSDNNQLSVSKIIDELKMYKAQIKRLYLIGDTETWNQNIGAITNNAYGDLNAISAAFGNPDTTVVDVEKWTKGSGMVQVNVHPATRMASVHTNNGAKELWKEIWK